MHTLRDDSIRKGFLIAAFFVGFFGGLLWLLRDVGNWVLAVMRAVR